MSTSECAARQVADLMVREHDYAEGWQAACLSALGRRYCTNPIDLVVMLYDGPPRRAGRSVH
jgi:hypothetical protein